MIDWMDDHKRHCLAFAIDHEDLRRAAAKAASESHSAPPGSYQQLTNFDKELETLIVKKLRSQVRHRETVGLLCSGGEDSVYLLILLVLVLEISPKLFCLQTKSNAKDVERLKKIAKTWKLELNIFSIKDLDAQTAYEEFIDHENRPPNDLAQPVHNALYSKAVNNHNCETVIDGQFCDTVLLSNPQNHFLYWVERHRWLLSCGVYVANKIPVDKNGKLRSRIRRLKTLLDSPNIADAILSLLNCSPIENNSRKIVEEQVSAYGTQMAFTVFFYYGLLESRERDKYVLCPQLISPFDDFSIANLANANFNKVIGPFVRKKPIRNLCTRHFPSLFLSQNTLPFELE